MTGEDYEEQTKEERRKKTATRALPISMRAAVHLRGFDVVPDSARLWTETQMCDGKEKRVRFKVVSLVEEHFEDYDPLGESSDDSDSSENRYLVPKRGK